MRRNAHILTSKNNTQKHTRAAFSRDEVKCEYYALFHEYKDRYTILYSIFS